MILRLDPPIPLVTPRGKADAHLVIDYGPEYSLYWVVFLRESGECWTYGNPVVRLEANETMRPVKPHRLADDATAGAGPGRT